MVIAEIINSTAVLVNGEIYTLSDKAASSSNGPEVSMGSEEFYFDVGMAVAMVLCAGAMSGLTMGLVALDETFIEIMSRAGTDSQKADAQKVKWFVKNHHWTLVTLLLGNAAANEALPIFLDKVVGAITAIILSVTAVLIFGEIIPAAVCTGPYQLKIAAMSTPLVGILVLIFSPVAYPISLVLDWLLGHDGSATRFRREELTEFIKLHGESQLGLGGGEETRSSIQSESRALTVGNLEEPLLGDGDMGAEDDISRMSSAASAPAMARSSRTTPFTPVRHRAQSADPLSDVVSVGARSASVVDRWLSGMLVVARESDDEGGPSPSSTMSTSGSRNHYVESTALTIDEVTMVEGVLSMAQKTAATVFTPLHRCFMLPLSAKLDHETMTKILESGFSRIPVYDTEPNAVMGMLITKFLLRVDPEDASPLDTVHLEKPIAVHPDMSLLDVLNAFQAASAHLALVSPTPVALTRSLELRVAPPPSVHILGILTLEDIIEALIQEPIDDEADALQREGALQRFHSRRRKRRPEKNTTTNPSAIVPPINESEDEEEDDDNDSKI